MKQNEYKRICKSVLAVALAIMVIISCAVFPAYAFKLPGWVWSALFRISKYGLDYVLNNCNLRTFNIEIHSDHAWTVDLGSIKFNNKSANIGTTASYSTKIATTWNQSRTRTNVSLGGSKRSFSSGSKYIAIEVVKPNGTIETLTRLRSGYSRFYQAYGNLRSLGTYDFRYIYTDSETWDLHITFDDLFYPDVPIYPQAIDLETGETSESFFNDNDAIGMSTRMYNLPDTFSEVYYSGHQTAENHYLTLQDLIDEVTDPITNAEVNLIRDYDAGDKVYFADTIKSINYDSDRNITEFKFLSTAEDFRALEFWGDITDEFSVGDTLHLCFRVIEIGKVNGFSVESFDYLEDYNYEGDAAPHIESYLCG